MTAIDTFEMSRAQHALATSNQPQLRRLHVTETNDHVLITGRVKNFYLKSLALETAKVAVEGERSMVLNIEVDY